MREFVKTASFFVKACGIPVNKNFFERRLQSHPDYPALIALSDTLDELGIPYSALLVDKERVNELSFPALLHMDKSGKGDFEIVYSLKDLEEKQALILSYWDGITLTIASGSAVHNTEHERVVRQMRTGRQRQILFLSLALFLAGVGNAVHFSSWICLLSFISLAGLFVCCLIFLHSIGKENAFVQQLCSSTANNGCDKVLHSRAGKFFGNTSLGDVGLVYFAGLFIFLSAMAVIAEAGMALTLLLLPAGLSMSVIIFSLYYQRKVVKAWCGMCLLVAGVLLLQVAVVAAGAGSTGISWTSELLPGALVMAGSFVLSASWFFIGAVIRKVAAAETEQTRMMKWKRDPEIFLLQLERSEKVDMVALKGDIVLGDARAPLQMTIISNPFCGPCAKAHEELEQLLAAYPGRIGLTIRFLFSPVMKNDKRKQAVQLIHEACRRYGPAGGPGGKHPVDIWYREMNLERFREIFQLPEVPDFPEDFLDQQERWCREVGIAFTPMIYFSGYQLPRQEYDISDIAGLVPTLPERLAMVPQERILVVS